MFDPNDTQETRAALLGDAIADTYGADLGWDELVYSGEIARLVARCHRLIARCDPIEEGEIVDLVNQLIMTIIRPDDLVNCAPLRAAQPTVTRWDRDLVYSAS